MSNPTLSINQAAAMLAGNLITDYSMMRFRKGWVVLLYHVGSDVSALRTDTREAMEPEVFESADDALDAITRIGFSTQDVGAWRPGAVKTERALDKAMTAVRLASNR